MFKKFFKCLMLAALVVSGCAFSSCGDDDPDPVPDPTPTETTSIVGVWKCVDKNGDSAILTFNSNKTGSINVTVDPSRATVSFNERFNWNTVDDASANHWLEIIHTGGDYWFENNMMIYILAGNTLQLDGFIYTRQ